MFTSTLALILILITLPVVILLWATESQPQRCRRLKRQGWTQQRIADHLGISRSTVQRRLKAA